MIQDNARKDCTNRSSFDTLEECLEAVKQAKIKRNVDLQPYLCSRCGKWHLSNPRYRDSAKIFIKECLHKKVYYNLGMAKNVANKVKEERGIELHAYRCPHCEHYHLTKNVVNFNSKLF